MVESNNRFRALIKIESWLRLVSNVLAGRKNNGNVFKQVKEWYWC